MSADTFRFKRDYQGHRIVVDATRIPRGACWAIVATLDGEGIDCLQSDDVWESAQSIIADALLELQDEANDGGTEDAEEAV
jgi:hypothetical protein